MRLRKQGFRTHAPAVPESGETKLLVRYGSIEVKIEVNLVMRGTVNPVRMASLTPRARGALQAHLEIPVVSLEDMYGGKLVAAMDRQHPRDLFDVLQLFAHEGITAGARGPISVAARYPAGVRTQLRWHLAWISTAQH